MIAASSLVLFFYLSKVYPNGYIAVGYLLFLQEQIKNHHHQGALTISSTDYFPDYNTLYIVYYRLGCRRSRNTALKQVMVHKAMDYELRTTTYEIRTMRFNSRQPGQGSIHVARQSRVGGV